MCKLSWCNSTLHMAATLCVSVQARALGLIDVAIIRIIYSYGCYHKNYGCYDTVVYKHFKRTVKEWWSNDKFQGEGSCEGLQNGCCIKVDKFNTHNDSDCLIVGEGSQLKVYKPGISQNASDTVLLEIQLETMVLQVETGKFTADAEDRQILILHPQCYMIYGLHRRGSNSDAGDQNYVTLIIKHSFTRKAYNMAIGPFGTSKARDLICIQALDGSFSFFDQDSFLFMFIFSDIIIPGPVCYIASSDLFVICKSNWIMEIYSYQQLEEFSELNVRPNKKNIPQWTYNVGEEILSVQVIRTSTNFSSVIALGERHLYCFQDNGLMKYMIRFDYMPICFYAYLIGWYYEPAARLLIMVASDDSKLFVYEGTTLLWSCDLLSRVISISRCFLNSLSGGIVALSTKGLITVCYLGTEPDLNSNSAPMNDAMDPRQVQDELDVVEESLQKILDSEEDTVDVTNIEEIVKIKVDVGKPVQNLYSTSMNVTDEVLYLLMCPVVVTLTCEDSKLVQGLQITFDCSPPFECSEPTICMDSVNGTEIVEVQVFLSSEADLSDAWIKIMFTIIDNDGKIYVLSQKAMLPLNLYCLPKDIADEEKHFQITLNSTHPSVHLNELFKDFPQEGLIEHGVAADKLSFCYRTTNHHIILKSDGNQYIIEANELTDAFPLLDNFINRLEEYHTHMGLRNFHINIEVDTDLIKQIIHKFLKTVEAHAKDRITLKTKEDELNVLQRQFTVIQKRLLVQYGSLPPGDCEPLEFLMRDTYERIIKSAGHVIESREKVCRAGCSLSAVGNLVTCLLKHTASDDFALKLVEEMLCFSSLYDHSQEYEEALTQATTYVLNNVIKKSEKDKEKLATIADQDVLSNVNLKKFLKQLRIVLEKMFTSSNKGDESIGKDKDKITRIEELVEVL